MNIYPLSERWPGLDEFNSLGILAGLQAGWVQAPDLRNKQAKPRQPLDRCCPNGPCRLFLRYRESIPCLHRFSDLKTKPILQSELLIARSFLPAPLTGSGGGSSVRSLDKLYYFIPSAPQKRIPTSRGRRDELG